MILCSLRICLKNLWRYNLGFGNLIICFFIENLEVELRRKWSLARINASSWYNWWCSRRTWQNDPGLQGFLRDILQQLSRRCFEHKPQRKNWQMGCTIVGENSKLNLLKFTFYVSSVNKIYKSDIKWGFKGIKVSCKLLNKKSVILKRKAKMKKEKKIIRS